MTVKTKQLKRYGSYTNQLIPLHQWNKKVKGVDRGKSPLHNKWLSKDYNKDELKKFVESGHNLGFKIGKFDLIVDIDPRNFNGEDSIQLVAELFGYFDFDELCEDYPVVKTGGGGYHIYCSLPEAVDYNLLKESLEGFPGVEFKHYGRQVVSAGSKHPNGNYYKWISDVELPGLELDKELLSILKRDKVDKQYQSGAGSINGEQLREYFLDKLKIEEYNTNDSWFPILCAAHHATNGEGVDEFVEWCLEDLNYSDCENDIRNRWESLSTEKKHAYTIGTLIKELTDKGEDSSDVKRFLAFKDTEETDDNYEDELLSNVNDVVSDIDIDDIYHTKEEDSAGVEGAAIIAANKLSSSSHNEEIVKVLRLAKAADLIERERTLEIICVNTKLKKATVNKIYKSLEETISNDLARIISNKTRESLFNDGKHIINLPSKHIYIYGKTHWYPISDDFLGKLITKVYDGLRRKIDIDTQENSLISQALSITKRLSSSDKDYIHTTDEPKPIINCKNGELWIKEDGTHELRGHNSKSFLLNCLSANYDPSAECPLFMQTIKEIFADYPDTDDIIRHLGEVMGYSCQPRKNVDSWFMFRGPGGDGKSTILKILGGVLQDAQLMTNTNVLSIGSANGNAHASASLVGKLAVVVEELPAGYLLKDAGLKMLAGNTKMEANPKGKDAFQFQYCGTLFMCSNGFPAIKDLSHGMQRRAHVIPFNRQFTKGHIEDIDRARKILSSPEEMSGVLNFMLEGLVRFRKRGYFKEPRSCEIAKSEWMSEANNVVRYVEESLEFDEPENKVLANDIYDNYCNWCMESDIAFKQKRTFYNDLRSLGIPVNKSTDNKLFVFGRKIVNCEEDDDFWG